ncbi:uncharacterized protein LOC133845271 isoform X1 [Drosophila sulfurigaster albostrigata]|uniref:uncharacterized protein LOC133845271 isoform X1 n=1 Tax=Drosophila sulfurigaster albostrigata TaxID=89887 RepID=UPI002D21B159|nr:uncharacterized protein LOC133845271 isoform X1 [Drosophila sulfurigaster albostrigata]
MENECQPETMKTYDQELVEDSVQHDNEVAKVSELDGGGELEADLIPNMTSNSVLAVVVQEPDHGRELESDSGISSGPDSSMEPRSRRVRIVGRLQIYGAERYGALTAQSIANVLRSMRPNQRFLAEYIISAMLALGHSDRLSAIMLNGRTNSDSDDDDAQ